MRNYVLEPVSMHYSALAWDFKVIFGNIYDCLILSHGKIAKIQRNC